MERVSIQMCAMDERTGYCSKCQCSPIKDTEGMLLCEEFRKDVSMTDADSGDYNYNDDAVDINEIVDSMTIKDDLEHF